MPFREPFDRYFERIVAPTIRSAGLEPKRGDSLFRSSPVMDDVWQMIREAEIIVAELTTQNANVFYELGLAHAASKPVILLSETMDDVPFDLRSLRVITYDKHDPDWGEVLRRKLATSIKETLADSSSAVAAMFRNGPGNLAAYGPGVIDRLSQLEQQVTHLRQDAELRAAVDEARPAERPRLEKELREVEAASKPRTSLTREQIISRKAYMTGVVVRDVDLSHADLSLSNFIGSDLREANLRNANLYFSSLNAADLTRADLAYADLRSTNLSEASLALADLEEVTGWEEIRAIEKANIWNIRNAPPGFREWALENGAVEEKP